MIRRRGRDAFAGLVGTDESAALQVKRMSREVYRYSTLANADDPLAINRARREALRMLAER